MVNCIVPVCKEYTGKRINKEKCVKVTFHKFPNDPVKKKEWADRIGVHVGAVRGFSRICSCHFPDDMIDRTSLSCVRLRDNAVPCINTGQAEKSELNSCTLERMDQKEETILPESEIKLEIEEDTDLYINSSQNQKSQLDSSILERMDQSEQTNSSECDIKLEIEENTDPHLNLSQAQTSTSNLCIGEEMDTEKVTNSSAPSIKLEESVDSVDPSNGSGNLLKEEITLETVWMDEWETQTETPEQNMEPSPGKIRPKHHKDFSADVKHAELERSPSENQEQFNIRPKKKLKSFTYEEKKKILEELSEIPPEILCKKYDLSDRTLRYWKSKKENIFEKAKNISVRNAKRIRGTQELDNQLLQWMVKSQEDGVQISGPLLKKQALIQNKNLLGPSNFKASEGWLSGWKKRKNIRCLEITGEKLSPDVAAAEEYTKEELPKLIASKQLKKKQIFNFVESCLYIKQMPDRTLAPGNVTSIPGTKKQFDRLTFGACCNADGSMKLPLVMIGKSAKPRCFQNVNMDQLPVFYRSQRNVWMVTQIFEEWFTNHFVPQVKAFLESENLPLVAVLIVERCKSHKYLKVDGIDVQFLSPHVTSLIQPCDQGILAMTKLNYTINLVHSVLESQTEDISLLQFLKNVNVKDSVYWVAKAWNEVETYTIIECWKKMLPIQTQDATTQTDGECSWDLLVSPVGTESVSIQTTNEKVGELALAIRKIKGYEAISDEAIAEWFKKIDSESEKEVASMKIENGDLSSEEIACQANEGNESLDYWHEDGSCDPLTASGEKDINFFSVDVAGLDEH